jgi:hypothetical protein
VTPLPNGNYQQRTRLNVVDSDGSAILYDGSLTGGTRLTRDLCGRRIPFCGGCSRRDNLKIAKLLTQYWGPGGGTYNLALATCF